MEGFIINSPLVSFNSLASHPAHCRKHPDDHTANFAVPPSDILETLRPQTEDHRTSRTEACSSSDN